jgi:hypothetical protein
MHFYFTTIKTMMGSSPHSRTAGMNNHGFNINKFQAGPGMLQQGNFKAEVNSALSSQHFSCVFEAGSHCKRCNQEEATNRAVTLL